MGVLAIRYLTPRDHWARAVPFDDGYDTPCMYLPNVPESDGYVHIRRPPLGKKINAHRASAPRGRVGRRKEPDDAA